MDKRGSGRTVLITGAAGILARHIARRLASEGYSLAVTDVKGLDDVVEELGASIVYTQSCDLSSVEAVDAFTANLLAKQSIDILINNAAIQSQYSLEDFTPELLRTFNRVNVEAPYQISKAVSAGMIERKWGRIINIVSGQSWRPYPNFIGYVTSKMGLVGLTRALAFQFGDQGITVNGVTPSATQTEENKDVLPESAWADIRSRQFIHRNATPADLVGAVSFLASDDAQFITGQTLFADGGLVIV